MSVVLKGFCLRFVCIALLLVCFAGQAHAVLFIDKNVKRIQENACIDIEFLERFEPYLSPRVFTVNVRTAEDMAYIMTVLYGCDILAEESKATTEDEYHDGTVYMIWGLMGTKADGSRKTIFDFLKSKLLVTIRMNFDERIYSTLDEALNSPEVARSVKQYGGKKINIQAFTLSGEDRGLLNLDRTLAN